MVDTAALPRLTDALAVDGASENVSVYVRTILGHLGVTAADLSRDMGMTQFQVSRRLSGYAKWTPLEVAMLADHFGVPVDDLLAGVPEPPWKFTG